MNDSLMNVSSAALYMGVSESWIRRHLHDLPHIKLSCRFIRFRKGDIDDYIESSSYKNSPLSEILPRFDLSLDSYDKMFLKWRSELKGQIRWTYGLGSVILRKTKNGEERFYLDYQIDNRRVRKAVKGARTRAEAVKVLNAEIADFLRGKYHFKEEIRDISFTEMADLFLNKYSKMKKKSWKTSDWVYLRRMRPFFGCRKLSEITPLLIEDYMGQRLSTGIKKCSVNRELSCLRKIFNVAIDWNLASENPVRRIKFLPENDSFRERVLTAEEEIALLEACPSYLASIIRVALASGMRKGEILCLKWENACIEKGEIRIVESKSGRGRKIPINSALFTLLKALKSRNGQGEYVFINPLTGNPYTDLKRSFTSACTKAGIKDLRFHDLRHTFASRLVKKGVDLILVKDLLGHSSVVTTQRYTHSRAEEKQRAVETLSQNSESKTSQRQIGVKYELPRNSEQLVKVFFSVN